MMWMWVTKTNGIKECTDLSVAVRESGEQNQGTNRPKLATNKQPNKQANKTNQQSNNQTQLAPACSAMSTHTLSRASSLRLLDGERNKQTNKQTTDDTVEPCQVQTNKQTNNKQQTNKQRGCFWVEVPSESKRLWSEPSSQRARIKISQHPST